MDIVLTPALKPAPRSLGQSLSPAPLGDRLSAAESRRAAMDSIRAANLQDRLAKVEAVKTKREELVTGKSSKVKEELEARLGRTEEKRTAQLLETKEKLAEHLNRVEMAQRDLEIHTEAARVALDFELKAKMMKAEENKDGQMEVLLKKIKDHEAYVAKVRENQETRLKPYFAELEMNIKEKLTIAEKRREEVLGKVVESAREEGRRADLVRQNRARIQEQDEATSPTPESA